MKRLEKISTAVAQAELDALLVTGGANILYATGCNHLEGVVLIGADGRGWCLTDSRYIETAEKEVVPEGYSVYQPKGKYPAELAALCSEHGFKKLGFEDEIMTVAALRRYEAAVEGVEFAAASAVLSKLRAIKEDWEIENMVAAQRIAEQALEKFLPEIKPGRSERELAALLDYTMLTLGSEGASFSTIMVSGPNSSLPHGVPGDRTVQAGDFVKIDFGATKNGYRSDMTRTFAVGHATDEMKMVYDTVLRAQLAGIEAFEEGKTGHEVHMAAASIIEEAGYGENFGHGLGHSIGINVHEAPGASRNTETVFETGHVITIEPGIYLPGRFGVRIEDMVYLGKDGKRNLTQFPKELRIL